MAIVAQVDALSIVEHDEDSGITMSTTRMVQVTGLTPAIAPVMIDEVKTELDNQGYENGAVLAGHNNLILRGRRVRINPRGNHTHADVTLIYKHFSSGGQNLLTPTLGVIYPQTTGTLQQRPTQVYPQDYTTVGQRGKPITVKHTFPDGTNSHQDEDGVTLAADRDFAGQTIEQGGQVNVFTPQETTTFRGLYPTSAPAYIRRQMRRTVNRYTWNGRPSGTWLCTKADYEYRDIEASPPIVEFVFEFQENPEGWDPDVIYVDQRTGKPPPGLVEGVGFKTLEVYQRRDFAHFLAQLAI